MEILQQRTDDRIHNVKSLAARIAKQAEGMSAREFMDASALAAGTLIKAFYKGPGVDIALDRYIEELRRAVA